MKTICVCFTVAMAASFAVAAPSSPKELARGILHATGIRGGLIVHVGCADGRLTAALHAGDGFLVQGLAADPARVAHARKTIRALGLDGPVSIRQFEGTRLPYIDNLVNLVVAEDLGQITMDEVLRVLCPNGVAYIRHEGTWTKTIKPRPAEMDQWTHYLHDASNDAVSHDTIVAPPRRLQWIGGPRWTRHHDRMSSISAVVATGAQVFYIIDEAPRLSILIPPRWMLVARDAFNGTICWKRRLGKWQTHLWPLKSGPAQLPRRLVADGQRVYVTLSLNGPLTALDAATGRTVRTYDNTRGTEEVIKSGGLLLVLVNPHAKVPAYADLPRISQAYRSRFWDEKPRRIMALRADSGEVLWNIERRVLPTTLAADRQRIFFHDGDRVVALDRMTGTQRWQSDPIARAKEIRSFFAPTLVVHRDVVLFAGGETAGLQTGSWYMKGKDTMTALSADTGKTLWSAYHPPSGYRSPEDLFAIQGTVWTGETTSGRATGWFTGRDLHTGKVKVRFAPDVKTYWFHHRCYRGKATDNFLLVARAGTEFIDIHNKRWLINDWVRGSCLYGVMPANGLLYAPPHPCACYMEAKLNGFNALAPAGAGPRFATTSAESRIEQGPAYNGDFPSKTDNDQWSTYRHDAARSGAASTTVPAAVQRVWRTAIGGKLSSPVIAGGTVFVAAVNRHSVHAIDARSGSELWQFTAGGRIDSPPTIDRGRVLFGSADGYVYCLRATDGALAWRFRAAPAAEQLVAMNQVESVWPVPGNVLVVGGVAYCVSGRSMFVDGGLRLWRLDPKTGRALSETVLGDRDAQSGKDLQAYVSWLNMPPALPDILSSDGRRVYMRSQPFRLDGTRLPLKPFPRGEDADRGAPPAVQQPALAHMFCPTGFCDDSWFHRSYWLYGSTFVSGWCGYYRAGKTAPAGRILVFDEKRVYGFGRKPKYFRWTTPIEYQLFAADKVFVPPRKPGAKKTKTSFVRVAPSASLNPAKKALTVEAWVKPKTRDGVVVARGGGAQGYALYLQKGHPRLAVRVNGQLAAVTAAKSVGKQWVHLAGVLTRQKQLKIYVNGKCAGTAQAPGMIPHDPAEPMEIGADEGSHVGDYKNSLPLGGLIDEVAIYARALNDAEIARRAATPASAQSALPANPNLVALYSFDHGTAEDDSGHGNNGTVHGAAVAKSRMGKALRLTGAGATPPGYVVKRRWAEDLPFFGQALVLAGETLFVAGPPDLIDEPRAFRQIDDPKVQTRLAAQEAALDGKHGGQMAAVSAADGKMLAHYKLDAVPVFDGLAAADGRLYMTTADGAVLCFAGK